MCLGVTSLLIRITKWNEKRASFECNQMHFFSMAKDTKCAVTRVVCRWGGVALTTWVWMNNVLQRTMQFTSRWCLMGYAKGLSPLTPRWHKANKMINLRRQIPTCDGYKWMLSYTDVMSLFCSHGKAHEHITHETRTQQRVMRNNGKKSKKANEQNPMMNV